MTVQTTKSSITHIADSDQLDYPFDFLTLSAAHMFVNIDGSSYNGSFTITNVGDPAGGTLVFDDNLPVSLDGSSLEIYREVPITQETDYVSYDGFSAESHERALDKLTLICQQLSANSNLTSIKVPNNDPVTGVDLQTGSVAERSGQVLGFDSEGRVITLAIGDGTDIAQLQEQLLSVSVGQTEFVTNQETKVVILDNEVLTKSSGSWKINLDGNLELSEPIVDINQELVVWNAKVDVSLIGSKANPHLEETLFGMVNDLPKPSYMLGDWIECQGRTLSNDGFRSVYQVTDVPPTFRRNYENYIPLNGDGADVDVTLWAVLKEGFKRDFNSQPIEIVAHRGFNELGVQNTILNYSAAVNYPCDALEGDWQITSDGFGVMFHDLILDDDTNGTGAIKDKTLAEVRALTFTELAGTFWEDKVKLSRIEEFFDIAVRYNKRVYIEVKDFRTVSDVQFLIDVIEAYNWETMTNIASFRIDDLVEIRNRNKKVHVGWLTTNVNSPQEDIDFDKLQKLKFADALIVDNIMVEFPAVQQKCYDAGIGVGAWGIQYELDIQKIMKVNVPRLIVDNPSHPNLTRGQQNVTY